MKKLLINAILLLALARFLPGMAVTSFWGAVGAIIVYSLISWTIGALLKFLTLPLNFISFGLVHFLIGGLLLYWTASWSQGLYLDSYVTALIASAILTFFQSLIFDKSHLDKG